jgi:hypothetical protein
VRSHFAIKPHQDVSGPARGIPTAMRTQGNRGPLRSPSIPRHQAARAASNRTTERSTRSWPNLS